MRFILFYFVFIHIQNTILEFITQVLYIILKYIILIELIVLAMVDFMPKADM